MPADQRLTPSLIAGPTKTTRSAFRRSCGRHSPEHLARPGGDDPDSFIFTTPAGEAVRHNLIYKRVFVPAARSVFWAGTAAAEERRPA